MGYADALALCVLADPEKARDKADDRYRRVSSTFRCCWLRLSAPEAYGDWPSVRRSDGPRWHSYVHVLWPPSAIFLT